MQGHNLQMKIYTLKHLKGQLALVDLFDFMYTSLGQTHSHRCSEARSQLANADLKSDYAYVAVPRKQLISLKKLHALFLEQKSFFHHCFAII